MKRLVTILLLLVFIVSCNSKDSKAISTAIQNVEQEASESEAGDNVVDEQEIIEDYQFRESVLYALADKQKEAFSEFSSGIWYSITRYIPSAYNTVVKEDESDIRVAYSLGKMVTQTKRVQYLLNDIYSTLERRLGALQTNSIAELTLALGNLASQAERLCDATQLDRAELKRGLKLYLRGYFSLYRLLEASDYERAVDIVARLTALTTDQELFMTEEIDLMTTPIRNVMELDGMNDVEIMH